MELAVYAQETGISTDADMSEKLNPLGIFTIVTNMATLCLNRQRAVWLTHGEGALLIHKHFIDKRKAQSLTIIKKKEAKEKKAQLDALVAMNLTKLNFKLGVTEDVPLPLYCINFGCQSEIIADSDIESRSGWFGCNTCKIWVCSKKACVKNLSKHSSLCAARLELLTSVIVKKANIVKSFRKKK